MTYFKKLVLFTGSLLMLASAVPLQRINAQEVIDCNEARLKNLSVAMLNCEGTAQQSTCGAGQLMGSDNPEKVWNYLTGKGMTPVQAAGAMGNLQHEGGFNPKRVEDGWGFPREMEAIPPNVGPAGQPGYGIVQWTSPGRKQGLATMAIEKNLPVYDLSLQLDYMWSELEGPYRTRALDPLLLTDDLAEATRIWQNKYEVGTNFQPRYEAAQSWLALYGSGTTIVGNGTGCQLDASGCPTEPIQQSDTVSAGGILVHPCIAPEVERIVELAHQQGLITFSGGGYRDSSTQIETRRNNCGPSHYDIYEKPSDQCSPPTAIPGSSRHERGTAVDFTCDGQIFTSRSHPCYQFLEENTSLINLASEPWHWSVDGN